MRAGGAAREGPRERPKEGPREAPKEGPREGVGLETWVPAVGGRLVLTAADWSLSPCQWSESPSAWPSRSPLGWTQRHLTSYCGWWWCPSQCWRCWSWSWPPSVSICVGPPQCGNTDRQGSRAGQTARDLLTSHQYHQLLLHREGSIHFSSVILWTRPLRVGKLLRARCSESLWFKWFIRGCAGGS